MIEVEDLTIDPDAPIADLASAVALAMVGMSAGDEIEIHDVDCELDENTGDDCTCQPVTLVVPERMES